MEDNAIIELYFQRSESAVQESDRKYGRYCGRIAVNILANPEDAEECVSDTWLKAWNAIPPTRPRILKTFFGRITRNLSLNRLEREQAKKRGGGEAAVAIEELAECIADPRAAAWTPDEAAVTEVLNAFLTDLPREKRVIFMRRYWYMESIENIASSMGLGESKVKMTLMRARGALKERLLKEGIEV